MKKYYFLCTTDVQFNKQTFKLHTFSLPFMVSVHGTQDVELYARAFWDTAFSSSLVSHGSLMSDQGPGSRRILIPGRWTLVALTLGLGVSDMSPCSRKPYRW